MTTFVALLRAVNVGGTGKLPMATLRSLCEEAGLVDVQTYIASGNVVLDSPLDEAAVRKRIEERLLGYMGKPIAVVVRTAQEMAAVVAADPFAGHPGNRAVVIFLDTAPPPDAIERAVGRQDERIALGRREIYVAYGDRMSESRLRVPAAKDGTARNLNTVSKLAMMAAARCRQRDG